MLIVDSIIKVRLAYFRDGKAIREIARKFNLARNTVKNIIRSGVTDQTYERSEQPRPKLGAFVEQLAEWLKEDSSKPVRHRRSAQILFEQLQREVKIGRRWWVKIQSRLTTKRNQEECMHSNINNQQRPRMRVIRLSNVRKPRVQMSNDSGASVEKRPARKSSPKPRVIEKLLPATNLPATSKTRLSSNELSQAGTGLVSDIISIFKKASKLRTQSILVALSADRNKPWATICKGKAINARRLASMLKPYDIHSKDLRFDKGETYKGYKREWFIEAYRRTNNN